jgi:hypothetical protein
MTNPVNQNHSNDDVHFLDSMDIYCCQTVVYIPQII